MPSETPLLASGTKVKASNHTQKMGTGKDINRRGDTRTSNWSAPRTVEGVIDLGDAGPARNNKCRTKTAGQNRDKPPGEGGGEVIAWPLGVRFFTSMAFLGRFFIATAIKGHETRDYWPSRESYIGLDTSGTRTRRKEGASRDSLHPNATTIA
jgi:hypothetical protein